MLPAAFGPSGGALQRCGAKPSLRVGWGGFGFPFLPTSGPNHPSSISPDAVTVVSVCPSLLGFVLQAHGARTRHVCAVLCCSLGTLTLPLPWGHAVYFCLSCSPINQAEHLEVEGHSQWTIDCLASVTV